MAELSAVLKRWVIIGLLFITVSAVAITYRALGKADKVIAKNATAVLEQTEAVTKARVQEDIKQSEVRTEVKLKVKAVQAAIHKEEANAQEPRPSLSTGQLDRLRRLQSAANAGIHSAE